MAITHSSLGLQATQFPFAFSLLFFSCIRHSPGECLFLYILLDFPFKLHNARLWQQVKIRVVQRKGQLFLSSHSILVNLPPKKQDNTHIWCMIIYIYIHPTICKHGHIHKVIFKITGSCYSHYSIQLAHVRHRDVINFPKYRIIFCKRRNPVHQFNHLYQ